MLIDDDLSAFIESPVMIIVGSCDHDLLPQIGRAAGAIAHVGEDRVELIISDWQWPATVENVRRNGQLAATKVGAMSKAQLTAFIDQQLA